jgi:UPF0716 family protein affecting phage T7 exclusion
MANPVGFWISIAVILLGAVVGGIMRAMGLGQAKDLHPVHKRTGEESEQREPARTEH